MPYPVRSGRDISMFFIIILVSTFVCDTTFVIYKI